MYICEEQKWDLEREVRKRDWEISDLNSQVNDLRGKFVKPTLKKVSKYENKFAKLQKKAAEFNFRNQLKVVKKKEFTLEEEDKENAQKAATAAKKKPDWSKKGDEKKEDEEGEAAPLPDDEVPPANEPTEGEPPVEGEPPAEGQPPADGVEGQTEPVDKPAEGVAPVEGEATEGQPPGEAPPTEGAPPAGEASAEATPEGGFETFKKLVINENYDIIALPETVLAPTENKEAVTIPHYSLVENRKNSGDGVVIYIKDSLKYKVVDLTTDNPEAHVSFEDLLEKIKKNGEAAVEGAPAEVAPQAEGEAPATEGVPPATEGTPTEGTEASQVDAPVPGEGTLADGDAPVEGATLAPTDAEAAGEVPISTEPAATDAAPAESSAEAPASEVAPATEAPASEIEPATEPEPALASPPIIQATA